MGIGLSSPSSTLDLKNGNQRLRFLTGSSTSSYTLDIGLNDDGINFNNHSSYRTFNFKFPNVTMLKIHRDHVAITSRGDSYTPFKITKQTNGDDVFRISGSGEVLATSLKVSTLDNFPDYVFGRDYCLLPLMELDKFIQLNHKLPEMPSAEEAKNKGVKLQELNRLMVQKIEELTLYTIDQEKKIAELEKKLETTKNLVSKSENQDLQIQQLVVQLQMLQKEIQSLKK